MRLIISVIAWIILSISSVTVDANKIQIFRIRNCSFQFHPLNQLSNESRDIPLGSMMINMAKEDSRILTCKFKQVPLHNKPGFFSTGKDRSFQCINEGDDGYPICPMNFYTPMQMYQKI